MTQRSTHAISRIMTIGAVAIGALSGAHAAHAELLLEPIVGYDIGKMKLDQAGDQGSANGVVVGGRLGFVATGGFFVAADVETAIGAKYTPDGISAHADYNQTTGGAVIGIAPVATPIRIWAGYNFYDHFKFKGDGGTFQGNSFKGGIGFTPVPYLSFNAEYILHTYTSYSSGGVSQDFGGDNVTDNTIQISLSIPLGT